jgi:hypothetical protein
MEARSLGEVARREFVGPNIETPPRRRERQPVSCGPFATLRARVVNLRTRRLFNFIHFTKLLFRSPILKRALVCTLLLQLFNKHRPFFRD